MSGASAGGELDGRAYLKLILLGAAIGVPVPAQTRLLISPLLFASLLVGTQGLDTIPAAVLATAAAWVAIQALDRRVLPRAAAA